jgi:hypothetical protein
MPFCAHVNKYCADFTPGASQGQHSVQALCSAHGAVQRPGTPTLQMGRQAQGWPGLVM